MVDVFAGMWCRKRETMKSSATTLDKAEELFKGNK